MSNNAQQLASVDLQALRRYRLDRVREQLVQRDYAGVVLFDPRNIRYATDAANMQVWTLHSAARYAFVPASGPVVLFDFHNCEFVSEGIETVDEVRIATSWYYFSASPRVEEKAKKWAAEIADLVTAHSGGNRRLALDHVDPAGAVALQALGLTLHDGQEVLEQARCIKGSDEVAALRASIAVCEEGMCRMRSALEPGISENELWAVLHHTNISLGGEWIETRLLASGPAHQSMASRVRSPRHRRRRPRRLRHRYDRSVRLLCRHLAYLAVWSRGADRRATTALCHRA